MTLSAHGARSVVRVILALYLLVLVVYSLAPSSIPGASMTALLPGRDLMAHALAYGLLTLLLCAAIGIRGGSAILGSGVAGALALGINGILELAQALVPWRTASLLDFAAGLIGTCVALAAWLALGRALGLVLGRIFGASCSCGTTATAAGSGTTQ